MFVSPVPSAPGGRYAAIEIQASCRPFHADTGISGRHDNAYRSGRQCIQDTPASCAAPASTSPMRVSILPSCQRRPFGQLLRHPFIPSSLHSASTAPHRPISPSAHQPSIPSVHHPRIALAHHPIRPSAGQASIQPAIHHPIIPPHPTTISTTSISNQTPHPSHHTSNTTDTGGRRERVRACLCV